MERPSSRQSLITEEEDDVDVDDNATVEVPYDDYTSHVENDQNVVAVSQTNDNGTEVHRYALLDGNTVYYRYIMTGSKLVDLYKYFRKFTETRLQRNLEDAVDAFADYLFKMEDGNETVGPRLFTYFPMLEKFDIREVYPKERLYIPNDISDPNGRQIGTIYHWYIESMITNGGNKQAIMDEIANRPNLMNLLTIGKLSKPIERFDRFIQKNPTFFKHPRTEEPLTEVNVGYTQARVAGQIDAIHMNERGEEIIFDWKCTPSLFENEKHYQIVTPDDNDASIPTYGLPLVYNSVKIAKYTVPNQDLYDKIFQEACYSYLRELQGHARQGNHGYLGNTHWEGKFENDTEIRFIYVSFAEKIKSFGLNILPSFDTDNYSTGVSAYNAVRIAFKIREAVLGRLLVLHEEDIQEMFREFNHLKRLAKDRTEAKKAATGQKDQSAGRIRNPLKTPQTTAPDKNIFNDWIKEAEKDEEEDERRRLALLRLIEKEKSTSSSSASAAAAAPKRPPKGAVSLSKRPVKLLPLSQKDDDWFLQGNQDKLDEEEDARRWVKFKEENERLVEKSRRDVERRNQLELESEELKRQKRQALELRLQTVEEDEEPYVEEDTVEERQRYTRLTSHPAFSESGSREPRRPGLDLEQLLGDLERAKRRSRHYHD